MSSAVLSLSLIMNFAHSRRVMVYGTGYLLGYLESTPVP